MSTVNEIKSAIAALSMEERAELVAELCGWSDDAWDEQMKRDSAGGKFDGVNREAFEASAQSRTLEEILGESRDFQVAGHLPSGSSIMPCRLQPKNSLERIIAFGR